MLGDVHLLLRRPTFTAPRVRSPVISRLFIENARVTLDGHTGGLRFNKFCPSPSHNLTKLVIVRILILNEPDTPNFKTTLTFNVSQMLIMLSFSGGKLNPKLIVLPHYLFYPLLQHCLVEFLNFDLITQAVLYGGQQCRPDDKHNTLRLQRYSGKLKAIVMHKRRALRAPCRHRPAGAGTPPTECHRCREMSAVRR